MRLSILLFLAVVIPGTAQKLVSAQYLSTSTSAQLGVLSPKAIFDVDIYKIAYNTVDVDGSPTVASGAMVIPVNTTCNQFPLISYNHGTVLKKEDVPSRNNGESLIPKLMASTGKVTVCPDYLGLGDNPGLHPYLHAESEATATIDLIRAVREYINDSLTISLNGEVFITGYSQGGHAAMATLKYIQDQNLYSEFNVLAAGPASGPYNLSGSQSQSILSNAPYSNPGYVCYLLFGLNRVYGDLYTNYSDILKSPYDQIIPPYFDGTYPMDSVNAQLPSKINDFIQDSVLQNFANASTTNSHPLWQALIKNDNYDWNPSVPMELYYCTQDEQVAFQNSLDAAMAMSANGANVSAINKGAFTHGGCVLPALSGAIDLFSSYETACQYVRLEDYTRQLTLHCYPNPATNEIRLTGIVENTEAELWIYNVSGQLVKHYSQVKNEELASLAGITPGIYLLKVRNGDHTATAHISKL